MFKKEQFRAAFLADGASANTANTYSSFLNRIDAGLGGLDEAIARDGPEAVMLMSKSTTVEPFETYRSHARSVLRRYIEFRVLGEPEEETDNVLFDDVPATIDILSDANFKIEKEMQSQVRLQISGVEPDLSIIDEGSEVAVATGKIDILARDAEGRLTVIELKAGKCPAGAMEQVLAYAQSLSEERCELARCILIAGSFNDRQRAAAKRTIDLKLLTYAYNLSFAQDHG